MGSTKRLSDAFCLIGDIVSSRLTSDIGAQLARLDESLALANERAGAVVLQPLTITIGDEFQGAFASLTRTLDAALFVRLQFMPAGELRFGLSRGDIQFDPEIQPLGQTGSAWYRAREAIDSIKETADRRNAFRRSAFHSDDEQLNALVNAYLILQDRILNDMDERDVQIALGMLRNEAQASIAATIGIDPAAVTRRKYSNRIDALVEAAACLSGTGT
jgi:SatD family (SatD)